MQSVKSVETTAALSMLRALGKSSASVQQHEFRRTQAVACPKRSDSGKGANWGKRVRPFFARFFRSLFSAPLPYSSHLFHYLKAWNRLPKPVSATEMFCTALLLCCTVRDVLHFYRCVYLLFLYFPVCFVLTFYGKALQFH